MTDALPLAVTRQGSGPPVVVLHGLLGRARNWQSIARALEDRFELILADLRNHGASPWSETAGYPAMAADVAALVEAAGPEPVRLIGHSMGGKVAMTLAQTRPELVAQLVLVDIAPVAYAGDFAPYLRAMHALDLGALGRRAEVDAALAPAVPDAAMRGFLLQNLATRDGRLAWQPNLDVLIRHLDELTGVPDELKAPHYAGPCLAIRGERSTYVEERGAAGLRALFPGIEILTVPEAGHWPHSERPAAFLELLAPRLLAA